MIKYYNLYVTTDRIFIEGNSNAYIILITTAKRLSKYATGCVMPVEKVRSKCYKKA